MIENIFYKLKLKIMSSIRNNVNLIGHLGADPEIKTTNTGKKYASFRVATTDSYKDSKDEWQSETQWHSIISFDNFTVERIENQLRKGSFIAITGKLTYRSYTDSSSVTKYFTEIRLESFLILDKKGNNDDSPHQTQAMDDLPF